MMTVKETAQMYSNIYVFHLMWHGERKVTYLPGDTFLEQVFGNFKVERAEVIMEDRNMNVELTLAATPVV